MIPCKKEQLEDILEDHVSESVKYQIFKVLNSSIVCFDELKSEHKRISYFTKKGLYVPPIDYIVGVTNSEKRCDGIMASDPTEVKAKRIPLDHTLKSFFELLGVLKEVKEYMNLLYDEKTVLSNFIQADMWQNKIKNHKNRTIIPLILFFDDVETGNGLGSHAGKNKLGVTYMSIPCLPKYYISRLNNIFLVNLLYSDDRKVYGNEAIFQPVIDELNTLKTNGLNVIINGKEETIYFEVGAIVGDNLDLNSVFGLVESFSSLHSCRICKIDKAKSKLLTTDQSLLRTCKNYEAD